MPRQYSMGARAPGGAPPSPGATAEAATTSLRERVGALRNLPPFIKLVWRTSPSMAAASLVLRLIRALLPVMMLYIGKLIIDEAVLLVQAGVPPTGWRERSPPPGPRRHVRRRRRVR